VLSFTDIHQVGEGVLASLLERSYAELLASGKEYWQRESEKWNAFDREAFASSKIGNCIFLSWSGDQLVGFGSFDPRGAPQFCSVGHHCILPEYQGRGFGRAQLNEILRCVAGFSPREIRVSTLDHVFFAPARRLYERAGFRVVAQHPFASDTSLLVLQWAKEATPIKGCPGV
jgi:GNAT superfamily N-acetyltransferase